MRTPLRSLAAAVALAASATLVHAQTTPTTPPAGGSTGGSTGTMGGSTSGSGMGGMQDSTGTMRAGGMRSGARRSGATDTALVAQLDSVNTAAKAGLTNLPASVAGPLLESLQSKLAAMGNVALRSIATDLGALRRELGMTTVNGSRVGAILRRVGPKVTRVAAGQSGAVRTTLREIGTELSSAGRQLTTGATGAQ